MSYFATRFRKAVQLGCPSFQLTATPANSETGISDKEAPRAASLRFVARKKQLLLNEINA
jgi:hypothetical protein